MEVVTSLSEKDTELALRRFLARRGPAQFYSDNARSFVSLAKYMQKSLSWSFIPEAAPWWGGYWERLIGTIKRSCRKTLGNTSLSLTELNTVVAELEERINRRPLVLSGEEPLTPGHFIFGAAPPGLLDINVHDAPPPEDLQRRWRHRLTVSTHLWSRWRNEYLLSLRQWRTKSRSPATPQEGEIVLIHAKPLPRWRWPLGKIESLIYGRDGKARAAYVRSRGRMTRRPLCLLYSLECHNNAEPTLNTANVPVEPSSTDAEHLE